MAPDAARRAGLTSTVAFPLGNLAPQGSVIKATAIDPSIIDADGVYRHRGPARVFTDEREAIQAVKGTSARPVREGDVIVLIGMGPSGTGMQETAQITTALRYLPWGKHVALITDGRFSGFSSGACIGHVGPEALDEGPIGRVRDDDLIEIVIDRNTLTGTRQPGRRRGRAARPGGVPRAAPQPAAASGARASRAAARRQPPLGGAAARQRRHLGRVRLRCRSDRRGAGRSGRRPSARAWNRDHACLRRSVPANAGPPKRVFRSARFAKCPSRRATTGGSSAPASSREAWACRPESSCCGRSLPRRSGWCCCGARFVGVVTQFFLNMEVERYTLATGETAVTGFNRFWKHWGLVFAVLGYLSNLWPGWAISSATLASYLFGGNPTIIAVVSLLVIGFCLTFAPVVYVALERLIFVKVAAVLVLVVLGVVFAIEPESWRALPAGFASIGTLPDGLSMALVFGAIAFAGSGGAQNLCQSNWIRDKGFGMGQYVPRLVSPVTGAPEAKDADATSYIFEPDTHEHGAVEKLVAVRQHRAGVQLRAGDGGHDRSDIAACALDALRRAESAEQRVVPEARGGATRSEPSRRGLACCSWPSAPFRCSDRRWASSITPAVSPPTF